LTVCNNNSHYKLLCWKTC